KQQDDAAHPRELARLAIRLQEEDAEEVREREADQQIRRPAVHVANQPPEFDLRDDELHRLVRFGRARPVIEEEENAGEDLYAEEEHRHPAQVVPDLLRVDRDALLFDEMPDLAQIEPFIQPADGLPDHVRVTTISASS